MPHADESRPNQLIEICPLLSRLLGFNVGDESRQSFLVTLLLKSIFAFSIEAIDMNKVTARSAVVTASFLQPMAIITRTGIG